MRTFTSLTLLLALFYSPLSAHAETDCELYRLGNRVWLKADCRTSETLFIPDGATLDGNGHTITAYDGGEGQFASAVIKNAGATAHVRDLVIDTDQLAPACHEALEDRLRGIYLRD